MKSGLIKYYVLHESHEGNPGWLDLTMNGSVTRCAAPQASLLHLSDSFPIVKALKSDINLEALRKPTWDWKYVSCGVDKMSAEAMSRCRRICRKEGLFLVLQFLWKVYKRRHAAAENVLLLLFTANTFSLLPLPPLPPLHRAHQHCLRSSLKLSGQLSGTGSCRLLLPTPQMIAEESTSL